VSSKCKVCKCVLSAKSSGGTSHLNRHRIACKLKHGRTAFAQSLLQFNPDGSARLWEYNADVARSEMCHLICRLDLPICLAESSAIEEYIKKAHNPRFYVVSRQTITRDIKSTTMNHVLSLLTHLKLCFFCCCDIEYMV
jgi:hypothetical protein